MSRTPTTTAQFLSIRIVSALAFVLLCGAALLGGMQKPKATSQSFWRTGTQAPLVNVKAYPKDFQRSSESRWRFFGEGNDQPDQPFAVDPYPYPRLDQSFHHRPAHYRDDALPLDSRYRPQTPRAPPLA